MKQLIVRVKGTGIQLLLENLCFTYLPSVQEMIDTVALISPEVGMNFDRE